MARLAGALLVAVLVFISLAQALRPDPVKTTLSRVRPRARRVAAEESGAEEDKATRRERSLDRLTRLGPLQRRLIQADLRFTAFEAVSVAFLAVLILTVALWFAIGPFAVIVAAGAVWFTGNFVLGALKRRRVARIGAQLPDYLQAVANGLRAGYALTASLESSCLSVGDGPLKDEIRRTVQETHIGIPLEEALLDLSQRIDLMELDLAITAILVQRQVGGNLAEVLDRIQETLRERVRLAAEVKTLTAQGRLSGLVVGLLPIGLGLGVTLLNPGFMAPLFTTPTGHLMLGVAGALELIGMFAISRIVRVEF